MKSKLTESDIRSGVITAIGTAVENGRINLFEGIRENFEDDCISTITEWFETCKDAHALTGKEYLDVVLDMACIYDVIVREENEMVTVEQVAKQLAENVSIEFLQGGIATYFFHMDEDGVLNPFGGVSFNADRDVEGMTKEEIYDTETLENESFRAVCEELTDKVNEWIKENL